MNCAVDCACSQKTITFFQVFKRCNIYISVSYISRISTCTSTKTPEYDNISEITLIKAKYYTEEFQVLF